MRLALSPLVHFIKKGYLADPLGVDKNFGAVVITAFEQVIGTGGLS